MADGIKARIAGVWKDLTPNIKVGGVWKTPDKVHIRVGGVWKEVYTALSVVVAAVKLISNYRFGSTCYAGVRVHSDGSLYSANNVGSWSSYEVWLDAGSNSQVWVQATLNSGTLDWTNSGTGSRLACTSIRSWGIQRSTNGTDSASIDLDFYDASTGGNLLDSQAVSLSAECEISGCPLCCFTPDTLISTPTIDKPISALAEGDEIMTVNGPERIEEVIVRHDVPIFELTFEDGYTLKLTPDHPLMTVNGPASLSQHEYKDIGIPAELKLGDYVYIDDGTSRKLLKIEFLRKEPVVFTFSNSLFYANGILVL